MWSNVALWWVWHHSSVSSLSGFVERMCHISLPATSGSSGSSCKCSTTGSSLFQVDCVCVCLVLFFTFFFSYPVGWGTCSILLSLRMHFVLACYVKGRGCTAAFCLGTNLDDIAVLARGMGSPANRAATL